jgi:FAD/FMN-containing dehydrogenase
LRRFADIVGGANALTRADDQAPYLREWRDRYIGKTPVVLRPGTTDEVSRIVALANAHAIGVVPQGGNTGLVGGQIPSQTGDQIVLSLARMKKVRDVDSAGGTMIVEAGVTLLEAQNAAEGVGRLFPLSLASEGSAMIGGVLATNAGGTGVLAYGNARHLALGLEAVLADGRIWNGLRRLKKDNTGYDLRDLLVGSEGTLGVITAAA